MTSVAYCYHVFVHVCICTCCMLRYAISFIGNLTVVLVAHVLVVFGLSWWGSRVSYVSLEGGLGPLFLYDLDITDRSLYMCGRVQLGVSSGLYAYTADLLTLAGRSETPLPALSGWSNIECPMLADVWGEYLASPPDRAYCNYLVHGLRKGFWIGFWYGSSLCRSA